MYVEVAKLHDHVVSVLVRAGAGREQADLVATSIVACQRDGTLSHGLQRLSGFVSSLESGWLNGKNAPRVTPVSSVMLRVDGDNGFSQVALAKARDELVQRVRDHGLATAVLHNIHHFGALWPDIEPFAREGFIALTTVSSRSQILAWDSKRKVFGTNPIAFACPTGAADPLVFDMAASLMSQGDVVLARDAGKALPEGIGVDAEGVPTTDPDAVLRGGALLPFAGAKGSAIAFMVEILAAALSGAEFGFEERSLELGASTSKSGQFLLVIDPSRTVGNAFQARVLQLIEAIRDAGATRLPSTHRYERRRSAEREGIWLDEAQAELLRL
jgi:delta1-piperideine-2-carboxylate reductase